MLDRYTLEPMGRIWTEENKLARWLEVELAVLHARAKLEQIPMEAYDAIREYAWFSTERIAELEERYQHDLIAFVECVRESLVSTPAEPWKDEVHRFVTSYDIEDPAMILLLREATEAIDDALAELEDVLNLRAAEFRGQVMIGRTHGQFAEPVSFGALLKMYQAAIARARSRLGHVYDNDVSEGKISGAVGSFAGMNPELERLALWKLELTPPIAETQILQRDRHAALLTNLAIIAGTIEQMCRTFWEMMRSDVGELMEPRKSTQRGSSAMPQKRNPILTERLIGMARLVRAAAGASLENIATPEHRDISQSSVERHIFPDATSITHYMIVRATGLVKGLVVNNDRMRETLARTHDTWAAQRVRYALVAKGVADTTAYDLTQKAAFQAVDTNTSFFTILAAEQIVAAGSTCFVTNLFDETDWAELANLHSYLEPGLKRIFFDE